MAEEKASGFEKAAILLLSLGEDVASEVMKSLEPKEIRMIGNYFSKNNKPEPTSVKAIMKEFCEVAKSPDGLLVAGEDYLRNVLTKAMGQDTADKIIENFAISSEGKGLESLKWIDARSIANLIKGEHPQTIALILVHLDSDHAGQVVTSLPQAIRPDVILRMATIESVSPSVIKEIEEVLTKQLQMGGSVVSKKIGGPEAVAAILNNMDRTSESAIMSSMEQNYPDLVEKIRQMMFVFEDLNKVDDRGIQEILKEVGKEELMLSLKGAGEELKARFLKNMSSRAAQSIKEDMEARGPVKLSDVEKAQQAILKITKRLEEEGKIVLGGKGSEEVLI
ncbi:MAG: flagellar motor switch protein FliG [Nitrospirae bacterium]|nr:flagellar motor switch protein FliG [Nitrospirota bacterium]